MNSPGITKQNTEAGFFAPSGFCISSSVIYRLCSY
jgi:hypothetical protein